MNKRLREFEKQSGLEIFGLGAKRVKWEAAMEKFSLLIVADCVKIAENYCETNPEICGLPLEILENFDMELPDA